MCFYQHREAITDCPSCRRSAHFTALYNNPDREAQCEDLPYSAWYPYLGRRHQQLVSLPRKYSDGNQRECAFLTSVS